MSKSVFYHAGCPVCVSAEHDIITLLGTDKVEVVHLAMTNQELTKQKKQV